LWIAERVWEPHLPKSIAEAGLEYTPIDDAHFKAAGYTEQDTYGYYLTEEQGSLLKVFPISERMRYLVPFRQVQETIDYLRSVATECGNRCVTLMDDGEKFGGWPDTYKWVYEDGWLESFFKALEDNADWITCSTFAEFVDTHPPLGRVYLPTASYTEMGEWALPPKASKEYADLRHEVSDRGEMPRYERFLRGGFWRNFLTKYEESNHLQKKMVRVSDKVEQARRKLARKKPTAQQSALLAEAERSLYRGQCNCPYWHGVFGGLYLNHLRFGVYRELLLSERAVDQLLNPEGSLCLERTDINADGREELAVETDRYHVILEPSFGGALIEIDWMKGPINLSDTLTRRPEAYHQKLIALRDGGGAQGQPASIHDMVRTKEPGLENMLFYDPQRRASLVERFVDKHVTVKDLWSAQAVDRGDFVGRPFAMETSSQRKGRPAEVTLFREGRVREGGETMPILLTKKLYFPAGDLNLQVDYEVHNDGDRRLETTFLSEWNLTLLAGHSPDRSYFIDGQPLEDPQLCTQGEASGVLRAGMIDRWLGLRIALESKTPSRFFRYPVETVSQSEGGFERVYQGSCLLWGWDLSLAPGETARYSLSLGLEATQP
jgi:alpha-amylase